MNGEFPADKLKQLLGDYRSDGSESDEADSDAGTSKIAASTKNDSKIDTSRSYSHKASHL